MSRSDSEKRVRALAGTMDSFCRRLELLDTDLGKAVLRIKVAGFGASFKGLTIAPRDGCTANEDLIVLAVDAFKRAQSKIKSPDSDGDTYEHEAVEEMQRAVDSLS